MIYSVQCGFKVRKEKETVSRNINYFLYSWGYDFVKRLKFGEAILKNLALIRIKKYP